MLASCILCVLAVLVYVYFCYRDRRVQKLIDDIPGPTSLPIIGNVHQFQMGHAWYRQLLQWCTRYRRPGIYKLWMMNTPLVVLYEAGHVETLLSSSSQLHKAPEYDFLHPWLRTGLLTSTGHKWRVRRKMLTPTFHFNILHDFMFVFNKQAEELTTKLAHQAGRASFNVFPDIALCALDIICESAMGKCLGAQLTDSNYVKGVYKMSTLVQERSLKPQQWNDVLYRLIGPGNEHDRNLAMLHEFTKKVILERLDTFDAKKSECIRKDMAAGEVEETGGSSAPRKVRLAFLDLLLSMSNDLTTLTLEDIQEEVDTFMFEGHDTTAAAMSWATYLIGANPAVQEKVHEELDRILGTELKPITIEDLKQLKYLECCIKEALRIYPSVPMFGRRLSDDLEVGEFLIPKDTTVYVLTSGLHRDPDVFPEPELFKPERFFLENAKSRQPYSYVPFSAGPRNCIGQKFALMEEKVVLAHLFRKFNVRSTQHRDEVRPVGELILRPEMGTIVELTARARSCQA